jgi:hypothetical protein
MKLQQVPARQGALWVRQGFSLFFRFPLPFSALFTSFLLGCLLLSTLPWIGPLLSLAAVPLVNLGFMIAGREAMENSSGSTPTVFIQPLQQTAPQRRAIIQLGLVYAVAVLGIVTLAVWVYGDSMVALQEALANDQTTQEQMRSLVQDPRLFWGNIVLLSLTSVLSIPFWHAPALTHWGMQPAGKALFFSWVACWRNKAAYLVYGLTWVAVGILFMVLATLMFRLSGQSKLVALSIIPAALMFITAFYASLYATYTDCFSEGSTASPQNGNEPHA